MSFGVPKRSLATIIDTLALFGDIEEAAVFGSRTIGNHKNGSDIDLVIYGANIREATVDKLKILLNEELPLPYHFDVIHYEQLTSPSLKEHIDKYAKPLYTKPA
ncbi:MAG: nucleotidyltransferase domain-containing protein [Firmicutes bacterium]|nr:nucleotidyltransferase domain-containing protein [Bacillota bacterium]